mgnify:FL=1
MLTVFSGRSSHPRVVEAAPRETHAANVELEPYPRQTTISRAHNAKEIGSPYCDQGRLMGDAALVVGEDQDRTPTDKDMGLMGDPTPKGANYSRQCVCNTRC